MHTAPGTLRTCLQTPPIQYIQTRSRTGARSRSGAVDFQFRAFQDTFSRSGMWIVWTCVTTPASVGSSGLSHFPVQVQFENSDTARESCAVAIGRNTRRAEYRAAGRGGWRLALEIETEIEAETETTRALTVPCADRTDSKFLTRAAVECRPSE